MNDAAVLNDRPHHSRDVRIEAIVLHRPVDLDHYRILSECGGHMATDQGRRVNQRRRRNRVTADGGWGVSHLAQYKIKYARQDDPKRVTGPRGCRRR